MDPSLLFALFLMAGAPAAHAAPRGEVGVVAVKGEVVAPVVAPAAPLSVAKPAAKKSGG